MKHLLRIWLARFFDKLKIKDQILYTTLITALGAVNVTITDPQVYGAIMEAIDDRPWVVRMFNIVSFLIAGIVAPRTSKVKAEAEKPPGTTSSNGQLPPKRKRKFIFF